MKNIYIKFINYNGKRNYFVYENDLDLCVHNGTYTSRNEQVMFYDIIYAIVNKYNYGKINSITIENKPNINSITYLVEVK